MMCSQYLNTCRIRMIAYSLSKLHVSNGSYYLKIKTLVGLSMSVMPIPLVSFSSGTLEIDEPAWLGLSCKPYRNAAKLL